MWGVSVIFVVTLEDEWWWSTENWRFFYWLTFEVDAGLLLIALPSFWVVLGMILLSSTSKEFQKAYNEYEKQERHKKLTSGYRCPNCGWSAGYEMSVSLKRVSVKRHGLASNNIGKTYQCASCGYKW